MASSTDRAENGYASGRQDQDHKRDHQDIGWSSSRNERSSTSGRISAGSLGRVSRTVFAPSPVSIMNDALDFYEKQYLPGQPKSLSGIAIRSFVLGIGLTLSDVLTIYIILVTSSPLWRCPFFVSTICLFHFLEFWTTARYNNRAAEIPSFLLTQNGAAYNIAHIAALIECLLSNTLFPNRSWAAPLPSAILTSLGLSLIIIGQAIRSAAMIEAGTNFNHIVQYQKSKSHRLVTSGVYAYLRHPSYFGFFWWGLGTQLVLGNPVCLVGYSVVLWRFFSKRIGIEEELLVAFFGNEYELYRKRTRVGIPFIW